VSRRLPPLLRRPNLWRCEHHPRCRRYLWSLLWYDRRGLCFVPLSVCFSQKIVDRIESRNPGLIRFIRSQDSLFHCLQSRNVLHLWAFASAMKSTAKRTRVALLSFLGSIVWCTQSFPRLRGHRGFLDGRKPFCSDMCAMKGRRLNDALCYRPGRPCGLRCNRSGRVGRNVHDTGVICRIRIRREAICYPWCRQVIPVVPGLWCRQRV